MSVCHPDNAIWPDPDLLDDATDEQVEIALAYGWTTLQALSGYQIAICPVTVRPCKAQCARGSYFIDYVSGSGSNPPFFPQVLNGVWSNVWCGHRSDCACTSVQEVVLPGPVGSVESVIIDGVTLDPEAYRVDNGNRLVRQDGEGWPVCQDFNQPAGEVGTFTVTYYHGATSDITVRYAAGLMAEEYLKAILGQECRLPSGTTQIVRQGMTITIEATMFENGRTGIDEVDAVIGRFNPFANKMPAQIFSLDRPRARTTTWRSPEGS